MAAVAQGVADGVDIVRFEQLEVVGILDDGHDSPDSEPLRLKGGDDIAAVVLGGRDREVDIVRPDLLH